MQAKGGKVRWIRIAKTACNEPRHDDELSSEKLSSNVGSFLCHNYDDPDEYFFWLTISIFGLSYVTDDDLMRELKAFCVAYQADLYLYQHVLCQK